MEYEEDNMDTLRTIKIRFEIGLELVLPWVAQNT